MSSIASLYIVKISDLPAIVGAAGSQSAWEALQELGREPAEEYGWSGYVMMNVLDGLETADVDLASPRLLDEAEAINADLDYTILITSEAKAFLDRLDPAAHDPADLLELGLDAEESGYAMEETLTLLSTTIAALTDDELLLLTIG
ncbi:hypothetical protein Q0Z83_021570 [Actinoplanes sichuanensis]|uniref:DUF1877 family protein n=1 Tax=Actinoplanes sichuanensis TaxID=512349 RepID=A0ABW4AK63_9ACTN|nr:hypothetical protein [Actinoplanes sichuanensis]BEL03966.1 hypothetical protein Q0Z83_021570 [Actinoplanes sichuanensis]